MLGQDVCVDKATNRVIVQQRDLDADNDDVYLTMNLGVNYVAGAVASDPNVSFQATNDTTTVEEGTSADSNFSSQATNDTTTVEEGTSDPNLSFQATTETTTVEEGTSADSNFSSQATNDTTTVEEGTSDPDETASAGRGLLALPLF